MFPFAYSGGELPLGRSQLSGEWSHGIPRPDSAAAGTPQTTGSVSAQDRSSQALSGSWQPLEQTAQETSLLVPAAGEADVAGQSQAPSVAGRRSGVASSQERGGGSAGFFGDVRYFFGLYGYYFSQNLDYYQAGLDVAGTIPGAGEPFDALNAGISAARGDWTGAGLSAASMIPIYGDAVGKGGKLARYGVKCSDEAAAALKGLDKANDARRAAKVATGQLHHAISTKVHKALEKHRVLRDAYRRRDPRLVTRAADKQAHYGYQRWHRDLDDEVVEWLERNPDATIEQFEAWLRWRYNQEDLIKRFPEGLP